MERRTESNVAAGDFAENVGDLGGNYFRAPAFSRDALFAPFFAHERDLLDELDVSR